MKNLVCILAAFVFLVSCKESEEERKAILSDSVGNINNLQVVIENDLWNGSVGEAVREVFAALVDGLPQDEPVFSISQLPPQAFGGFTQKQRIFLFIQKENETNFRAATNYYAKPQRGYFISAPTNEEIIALIKEKGEEMTTSFRRTEITEKQRRMALSTLNISSVEETFGLTLKIPSVYRIAKLTDDFAWIRKDIRTGTMNLMIYTMPYNAFDDDETRIRNIIKMRDSIGETHIEGPTKGSYMITEEAFAPYLFTAEVDGKFAYETKGTWEVKNDFMAGPFVNYIIKDSVNNRLVVLEGFTFAPSIAKRDYQFELESIIKSVKIK